MEENDLIAQALAGNPLACTQLVSQYRDSVLKYISTIVPGAEDCEDICQVTFQKCFRHLSGYDNRYAFSTWLFTIAQNSALDFLRKKRLPLISLSNVNTEFISRGIVSAAPSPEESLIHEQAIENLLKSIQNLSPIYRKIAELRFIHEYPLEEISKELGIPLNTVKTRVSRAKKILNKIWKS